MKTSVQINVRLSREMRGRFADLCAQQGLSVSEALRRMIERAVILKTVTPDDDIWDAISKGQLPAGFKNRFAMLPELTRTCLKRITKATTFGSFAPRTNGRIVTISDGFRFLSTQTASPYRFSVRSPLYSSDSSAINPSVPSHL